MAEFGVFKNAFFSIGGVDLSDHVSELTLPRGCEVLDDTVMGDDTRSEGAGLLTWGTSITLTQDYAAGEVDVTINALVGTVAAVVFRPDAGVKSATNPEYGGNALVKGYVPIGGSVGDHLTTTVDLGAAGDVARTTT